MLPIHLPVILWIVYRLLRNMRRRKKLRAVALERKLKLKKISQRNVAIPTMLALLAPGLETLGAEGLNELVVDLHGGATGALAIHVHDMPNLLDGNGPMDGVQNQDFHLYGATTAALSGNNFCLASLAGEGIVDVALGKLEEHLLTESHLEEAPPEGFTDLVQALLDGVSTGGILRSNRFIFHCDRCTKKLQDEWFSCPICDDYDICTECFTKNEYSHNHELSYAKQAEVTNEIDQLRRLLGGIQGGALTIAEPCGAYTFCDGCNRRPANGIYYSCKQCKNFDLCRGCLIDPAKRGVHGTHDFIPVKAAPQTPEAGLPPSPTIHLTPPASSSPTMSRHTSDRRSPSPHRVNSATERTSSRQPQRQSGTANDRTNRAPSHPRVTSDEVYPDAHSHRSPRMHRTPSRSPNPSRGPSPSPSPAMTANGHHSHSPALSEYPSPEQGASHRRPSYSPLEGPPGGLPASPPANRPPSPPPPHQRVPSFNSGAHRAPNRSPNYVRPEEPDRSPSESLRWSPLPPPVSPPSQSRQTGGRSVAASSHHKAHSNQSPSSPEWGRSNSSASSTYNRGHMSPAHRRDSSTRFSSSPRPSLASPPPYSSISPSPSQDIDTIPLHETDDESYSDDLPQYCSPPDSVPFARLSQVISRRDTPEYGRSSSRLNSDAGHSHTASALGISNLYLSDSPRITSGTSLSRTSSRVAHTIYCDACQTLITTATWNRCSESSCKDMDLHEECSMKDIGPHKRWHSLVVAWSDSH